MKVTLLMALTADGKIGRHAAHFPDWSGKEDKRLFKRITQKAGVIIMGSKTFDTIGRPLPGRKNIVLTRNPEQRTPQKNLTFTDSPAAEILSDLAREGFAEAVLIGGAKINSLFAKAGLLDEMILTYSPLIFGTGLSLFAEEIHMALKLKDLKRIGENLVYVKYTVL